MGGGGSGVSDKTRVTHEGGGRGGISNCIPPAETTSGVAVSTFVSQLDPRAVSAVSDCR